MTIQSAVILLIIATSAVLTLIHKIHRGRINRSAIFVPGLIEIRSLERDLDRIQEIRHGLAAADGSLRGRISALTAAAEKVGKEEGELFPHSTTNAFLKVRESSEKAAVQHQKSYMIRPRKPNV